MSDSKVWIVEGSRTVSWRMNARVAVGHHRCRVCGVATPTPTDGELIGIAKDRLFSINSATAIGTEWIDCGVAWPFEHWEPEGWRDRLCPACVAAVDDALAARKASAEGKQG